MIFRIISGELTARFWRQYASWAPTKLEWHEWASISDAYLGTGVEGWTLHVHTARYPIDFIGSA